jgi:CRISPR system Cascade subunit CasE
MMETHMVQITLDARKLSKWALDRRMDAEDLGYVCHALLCDAVGNLRPKPFTAEEKMGKIKLLGYARSDATTMKACMAETAEPEVETCILDIASKPMPSEWQAGKRYRFQLRVAPTRQGHHEDGGRFEKDAQAFAGEGTDRYETYLKWLSERLDGAASIESCEMIGFRTMKACRRSIIGSGKRPARTISLPDAKFEGTLMVTNSTLFAESLRTGIGRHKAFGFGALMLRPPMAA